jgi:hypothetical protein
VAVDEQVWAEDLVVGQPQPVLGLVGYGDGAEAGEARELEGQVC